MNSSNGGVLQFAEQTGTLPAILFHPLAERKTIQTQRSKRGPRNQNVKLVSDGSAAFTSVCRVVCVPFKCIC